MIRKIVRNPFVWAFLAGVVLLTAIRPLLRHVPEPPPVQIALPEFTLEDQDGNAFTKASFSGSVWIAARFSMRCGEPCGAVIDAMKRLRDAYDFRNMSGVRFACLSTDPAYDTPARLHIFANALGIDPTRWHLLTGDAATIAALQTAGFSEKPDEAAAAAPATVAGATPATGAPAPPLRPRPLILIDGQGRIRGWYAIDADGLDEVFNRAQHVLNEPAPAATSGG